MSLHDSRPEHNPLRRGLRWLGQTRPERIASYFTATQRWVERLHTNLPRWAAMLRDTARQAADQALHETLPRWTNALRDAAHHTGDELHRMLPWWERALRNVAPYADRAQREIRIQRERALKRFGPYTDAILRDVLPAWIDRYRRYAGTARREMLRLWADARQYAAPYADRVVHQVLPEWMDILRAELRHLRHALDEMLPRWEHALRDGASHTARAARRLMVASAIFADRHAPFRPHERNWRRGMASAARSISRWAAIALVITAAVAFALNMASHSSLLASLHLPQPATADSNVTDPVALHKDGASDATPTVSAYQVGMWTSASNPPASGTIQVYVRVSQNTAPAWHAIVSLQVQEGGTSTTLGPYYTGSYGLASFTVSYSGLSSTSPVQFIANVSAGGQTYTAQIVLVR